MICLMKSFVLDMLNLENLCETQVWIPNLELKECSSMEALLWEFSMVFAIETKTNKQEKKTVN